MLLAVLVLAGFAFYIMNRDERVQLMGLVRIALVAGRRIGVLLVAGLRAFVRALRAKNRLAQAGALAMVLAAAVATVRTARTPPADVRPEIAQLLAAEARIASIYDAATTQFKLGALSADSLAQVIERRIKPELQVVRIRIMSLENVRSEQEFLLEKAKEYLRLRGESWRMRADALHRRNMTALRKVESTERASLAALDAAVDAMKRL